jgi:hypothetical protein
MWGMRASAEPEPTVVVVQRRRWPRPVVWLLWLLGALVGSVVLGFLAGLARPREPDPWVDGPPAGARPGPLPAEPVAAATEPAEPETASSDARPLRPEET